MIQVQHDSLTVIANSVIAGGTAAVLASPDHTTQILSVIIQILSVVVLFFRQKKQS
jgi:hypothetical protein